MPTEDSLPDANSLADMRQRFLQRTRNEIGRIRELLQSTMLDADTLRAVAELAHKMSGTGDLLGLSSLAAAAGNIETLCSQRGSDAASVTQLQLAVDALAEETARALGSNSRP